MTNGCELSLEMINTANNSVTLQILVFFCFCSVLYQFKCFLFAQCRVLSHP